MSIDEIRRAFVRVTAGRTANIFKTSFIQPIEEGCLPDAFGWLQFALEYSVGLKSSPSTDQGIISEKSADKLDFWLSRTETDTSPKEFLDQFNSFSLPAWDHYTHLRIAFLTLTTYGRKEGKKIIASIDSTSSQFFFRKGYDLQWDSKVH